VLVPDVGDFTRLKESLRLFLDCFSSSFFVSFSTILRALAPRAAMLKTRSYTTQGKLESN